MRRLPTLRRLGFLSVLFVLCSAPAIVSAQSVTYHLHEEKGQNSYPLLTAPPDSPAFAIVTADLKSTTNTGPQIAVFESQPASINNGEIPAGATFSASLWLKKSSTAGTVFPTMTIASYDGAQRTICSATGSTALTTTLTKYTISCTSSAPFVVQSSTTFWVAFGGYFSVLPGSQSLILSLDVEGTLNGNYDSQFIVPQPVQGATVTALDRTSGISGDSVVISGSGFGGTQGTGGITFNGASAAVSAWSESEIVTSVPTGATTGDVVAWINGLPSNGLAFTVFQPPAITSLSPAGGSSGQPFTITGTNFGATQGTGSVTLNAMAVSVASWTDTSIQGIVPPGASSGPVVVTTHGQASNGVIFLLNPTAGQSSTYHLHKEASTTSGLLQLLPTGPDGAILALQSVDLKSQPVGWYVVKEFDTQSGVAPAGGTISAGSTLSFTLWMKTTSTYGVLMPLARARLNSIAGPALCDAAGATALTTTLTAYALSCVVNAPVNVSSGDRIYVWVGVNLLTAPGNRSAKGELDIEGVLNGNYDSRVAVPTVLPLPALTALNPSGGTPGMTVTITGSNFGAVQEYSTVTFSGVQSSIVSWSDTSIRAIVPDGVASGPVVVTRYGQSNALPFTRLGAITGTVQQNGMGPVAGAVVQALLNGELKGTTSSSSSGTYMLDSLPLGTYEVVAAVNGSGFQSHPGVLLTASSNPTVNFVLTFAGQVNYAYDPLNRLVSVNGNGQQATYSYDAVGNLLSIARSGTGTVRISSVTPITASAGTPVTVYGTGFSPDLAQNVVRFNGVAATVIAGAVTQLTVVVPSGASTGPVTVTAPSGSATGPTFSVIGQPTITSFSPTSGAIGTTVTITGENFNPDVNTVKLNSTPLPTLSVTPTAVTTTVTAGSSSGKFSVAGPEGLAVSGSTFLVIPAGQPFSAYPIGNSGTINVGQSAVVSLASGTAGYLLFEGTQGQRVNVTATNVSSPAWCTNTTTYQANLYLFDPTGALIGQSSQCDYIAATTLAMTGTYEVVITYAQTATITVNDVTNLADKTAAITIGGATVEMLTDVPGQLLRWNFAAVAGQPISLYANPAGIIGWCVTSTATLTDPAGNVIASWDPCNYQFGQPFVFSASGNYTITSQYYRGEVGKGLYVHVRTP